MKYLVLRDKDKELLLRLHDFIYIDSDFIAEFIFNHYTSRHSVMTRLRTLEDAGYIKSFTVPVEWYSRPANVYTLTLFGAEMVEQIQGISNWNNRWTRRILPWYQHQLMINRVVIQYEKKAKEVGLELKEWISEARATWQYTKERSDVIKPDGVMIIGAKGSDENIGIFLEMERSIAKRQKTIRKIARYNDFLNRGDEILNDYDLHVGFEAPVKYWRVLFIGGNEPNTKKTIRDIQSLRIDVDIPVLVASRKDCEQQPYGAIYHHMLSDDPSKKQQL